MSMDIIETRWRTRVESSRSLEGLLSKFPLDKEFVDWVAKNGYAIHYANPYPNATAKFYGRIDSQYKIIIINPELDAFQQDITLVHELIHLAVPLIPFENEYETENSGTIDKIAEKYVENKEFMDYIKKTIKTI